MVRLEKYNTATSIYTVLRTAGSTVIKSNPTLAAGDVKISKDGGAFVNLATLPDVLPAADSQVRIQLSAAEMQCKYATIIFLDQTSPAEWDDNAVEIQTYGNASASIGFDLSQATPAVNMTQVDGAALSTHTSGMVPSDLRNIVGAAVSTSSAQLGVNAVNIGGVAQTGRDIGASVLISSGTGAGQLDVTSGVIKANMTQIDGQLTNGNNATLNLKQLNIVNNNGNAVIFRATTIAGAFGLFVEGVGTGSGVWVQGGSNAAGMEIYSGASGSSPAVIIFSTGGDGLSLGAGGTGSGITAAGSGSGHGMKLTGGATGDGMQAVAGADGHGIQAIGGTSGAAWYHAIKLIATKGCAINAISSATGTPAVIVEGKHGGLFVRSTDSGHGAEFKGFGIYSGIRTEGGATGHGINMAGGATSGNGIHAVAAADGNGASLIGAGASGSGMLLTRGGASGYDLKGATPSTNLSVTLSGTADANVVSIDGQLTNGNNATLNLKQLNVVNSAGDAIVASASGGNGTGFNVSGNGSGHGARFTGGVTGSGIKAEAGASGGNGIFAVAQADHGIYAESSYDGGDGINAFGARNGIAGIGTDQDGITGEGGTNGIDARSTGGGQGMQMSGDIALDLQGATIDISGATQISNVLAPADVTKVNGAANPAVKLSSAVDTEVTGSVDDAAFAPTTTQFETDLTYSEANHLKDRTVIFTSGILINQARLIVAYSLVGGRGKLTVQSLSSAPSNGDTFIIV